jgi:hypothetical protein
MPNANAPNVANINMNKSNKFAMASRFSRNVRLRPQRARPAAFLRIPVHRVCRQAW